MLDSTQIGDFEIQNLTLFWKFDISKAKNAEQLLATIQYLRNAEYPAHISEDACLKATDPCEGWHVVSVLQRLVTRDILHLAVNLCMTKTMCMLCLYVKWVCFKALFIGPESNHWLCLSLTNSLTDCCLVNLIDVTLACEDGNSKLVEVDDEKRVDNSLVQILEGELWS